jgi:hypothetical protein
MIPNQFFLLASGQPFEQSIYRGKNSSNEIMNSSQSSSRRKFGTGELTNKAERITKPHPGKNLTKPSSQKKTTRPKPPTFRRKNKTNSSTSHTVTPPKPPPPEAKEEQPYREKVPHRACLRGIGLCAGTGRGGVFLAAGHGWRRLILPGNSWVGKGRFLLGTKGD